MRSIETLRNWVGDAKNLSRQEIQMVLQFQRDKLKERAAKKKYAALVAQRIRRQLARATPPPPAPNPMGGYYIKLEGGQVDWVPIQRKVVPVASQEVDNTSAAKLTLGQIRQATSEVIPPGELKCDCVASPQLTEPPKSHPKFLRSAA